MQAVILAAGMGKRLRSKTEEHTKGMVSILGKTFLEWSLDRLVTHTSVKRIVLVIGYCGDEIRRVLGDSYGGVPILYVENAVYASTNNIYSLYLTKDYLVQDDTLLLESDLIYEGEILRKLEAHPHRNLAVVDQYKPHMDGTAVKINADDQITAFIPKEHFDYKEASLYYKTVNIYKFSREFLQSQYIPFMEAYIAAMGKHAYYEQVLRVLLALERSDLKVLKLNGEKWYEVDDLQDYDIAQCLFSTDVTAKAAAYHSRFGGYWRFPEMKDYCYLVNPYFPPMRMVDELKHSFTQLLVNYPSGQAVMQSLVANNFSLSPEMSLVGNGAAELIHALLSCGGWGRVGVHVPTFQEYTARVAAPDEVVMLEAKEGFSYTADDMIHHAPRLDTLVWINPDNPSGHFLPKDEVLRVVEHYRQQNKRVILDESFVDFADGAEENSVLQVDLLRRFPNLIVIKSISKSYGVPGIRLGILATADQELILSCRKSLPVWNINSYGEFFLQILPKYKAAYREACVKLAAERKRFAAELERVPYLRPFPSQANYILCEVLPPQHSDTLCRELLRANFLIKDCRNKLGFHGRDYVRLAVKSEAENDELIAKLLSLA